MSVIHFLNVFEGDCNIIQHDSGRNTVIDISNGYNKEDTEAEKVAKAEKEALKNDADRNFVPNGKTNYHQKKNPDNSIDYISKLGISQIWRFIITHPDMDHLDGIKDLYNTFSIPNTWDTNNTKAIDASKNFAGFNKEDWEFYTQLRDGAISNTRRVTNYAESKNSFWVEDDIKVLCPTPALLSTANNTTKNWNDASYVLLYTPLKADGTRWKILFAGDSEDGSWEYILANHKADVTNVDVLFAPHHGRDSGRSYEFLKTVQPRVTLFGNASSKHLAYDSYQSTGNRKNTRITNNQAGYVVLNCTDSHLSVYVKNYQFMVNFRDKRRWETSPYNTKFQGYHLTSLR